MDTNNLNKYEYEISGKAVLKLTIRAAGFKATKSRKELCCSYPRPMVCDVYNRDINLHESTVILHLAPSESFFIDAEDSTETDKLKKLYEMRKIHIVQPNDCFRIRLQTAFCNIKGEEIERSYVIQKGFSKDESFVVLGYQFLYDKMHIEKRNDKNTFFQFWCAPPPDLMQGLLELCHFTRKPAGIVLNYLFETPNRETRITLDRMIEKKFLPEVRNQNSPRKSEVEVFQEPLAYMYQAKKQGIKRPHEDSKKTTRKSSENSMDVDMQIRRPL